MPKMFMQKVSKWFDTLSTPVSTPTSSPIPRARPSSSSTIIIPMKRPLRTRSHSPNSSFRSSTSFISPSSSRSNTNANTVANSTNDHSSVEENVELQLLSPTGRRRSPFLLTLDQQQKNLDSGNEEELPLALPSLIPLPAAPKRKAEELTDDSDSEMSFAAPGMFPSLDDPKTLVRGEAEMGGVEHSMAENDLDHSADGEAQRHDGVAGDNQPQLAIGRCTSAQTKHPVSANVSSERHDEESSDFVLVGAGGSGHLHLQQPQCQYQYQGTYQQHRQRQDAADKQTFYAAEQPNQIPMPLKKFITPSQAPPQRWRRSITNPLLTQSLGEVTRARWARQDPDTRKRWRERRLRKMWRSHWP